MPRTQPTSIVVPDALKADLRKIAEARKWKLATTIIHALTEWVAFHKQQAKKK